MQIDIYPVHLMTLSFIIEYLEIKFSVLKILLHAYKVSLFEF